MSEIRYGLVALIRDQIAQGDYLTPHKLAVTCDRLIELLTAGSNIQEDYSPPLPNQESAETLEWWR